MTKSQAYYPWRRFFARMFDITIYETLWLAVLGLGFHVQLHSRAGFASWLDTFVAIAIMLLVEPLWLHFLGTTPGKAIFGLRIRSGDGSLLTVGQARARTWGVVGAGLGYNIPIYYFVRLWKSYRLCSDNEPQPWDEDISYTIRDTKAYRWALLVAVHSLVFVAVFVVISVQRLPPNRGDLTVAEFAQNYNYYADYYEVNADSSYLDETGNWAEKPNSGTVYIDPFDIEKPTFTYTEKNGYLTGVSFAVMLENKKGLIPAYHTQMLLSALAFAGAQREVGVFTDLPKYIAGWLSADEFGDHSLTEAGVRFVIDTEHRGYDVTSDFLLPQEGANELFFSQVFSVVKQ